MAAGEAVIPSKLAWADFRARYQAEVVPGLAKRTAEKIELKVKALSRNLHLSSLSTVFSIE